MCLFYRVVLLFILMFARGNTQACTFLPCFFWKKETDRNGSFVCKTTKQPIVFGIKAFIASCCETNKPNSSGRPTKRPCGRGRQKCQTRRIRIILQHPVYIYTKPSQFQTRSDWCWNTVDGSEILHHLGSKKPRWCRISGQPSTVPMGLVWSQPQSLITGWSWT